MTPGMFEAVTVAILLVGIGVFALVAYLLSERRRDQALAALAHQNGWRYEAVVGPPDQRYQGFKPFRPSATDSRAHHVMTGHHEGQSFELLEYQFTTNPAKTGHDDRFRVCSVQMPVHAPHLMIRPEKASDKVIDRLGDKDIDFESAQFSRRHWVTSHDRRFAYDVLDAQMQQWLLAEPPRMWQWIDDRLVLVERGRMDPALAMRLLEAAVGFRAMVPRHVTAFDGASTRAWQLAPPE